MEKLFNRIFEKLGKEADRVEFWIETKEGIKFERRKGAPFLEKTFKLGEVTVRWLNEKGLCGISYTTSLEEEAVYQAVLKAKALSEVGLPSLFPELRDVSYPALKAPKDRPFSKETVEEKLREAEAISTSFPEVKEVEKISLSTGTHSYVLCRKEKFLTWEEPFYTFLISLVAEEGEKSASSWEWLETRSPDLFDIKTRTKRAAERAVILSRTRKGKSLKAKVLFPPFVMVDLLELLSFSFSGEEVLKGRSFLKDKPGKKVFSEKIIIIDDGLLNSGLETRPFDDEGMPQSRKVLVEKGVVKGFLSNFFWKKEAEKQGIKGFITGCARRSGAGSLPRVSSTNFFLSKGTAERQEMLAEGEVFEVLEVLGMHMADPISGNFSIGVSGVLYSRGEPVRFLAELALSANLFELFNRVIKVGSDFEFYGSFGSPSILVDTLDLGGR